jgi:plastocyanin
MRRIALVALVASCNLADPPETRCTAGFHADNGQCTADTAAGGNVVTIDACAPAPDPLGVTLGTAFTFTNHDAVAHDIHGADGQLWTTVAAGATADPAITLAKAGSWAYTVSGCTKGGTIVVR